MTVPTNRKNCFNFAVIRSWIWIPDHFSTYLNSAEYSIFLALRVLQFLVQPPAAFHETWRNDRRQQDSELPASVALSVASRYALPGDGDGESGFEAQAGPIIVSGYSSVCFEIKFSGRHRGFDGVFFNL